MAADNIESTFNHNAGNPERENQKRRAKKASEEKKILGKLTKTFYTMANGKILKKIAKPKGVHTIFICREKSLKKQELNDMIKRWEKEGVWIAPHLAEDTLEKAVKELQKERDQNLKEK